MGAFGGIRGAFIFACAFSVGALLGTRGDVRPVEAAVALGDAGLKTILGALRAAGGALVLAGAAAIAADCAFIAGSWYRPFEAGVVICVGAEPRGTFSSGGCTLAGICGAFVRA